MAWVGFPPNPAQAGVSSRNLGFQIGDCGFSIIQSPFPLILSLFRNPKSTLRNSYEAHHCHYSAQQAGGR
jgi:hypothetical protein